MPVTPYSVDISRLPEDVGTGRLQNLLVTFDNFERAIPLRGVASYPIKIDTFFTFTLLEGSMELLLNLRPIQVQRGQTLVLMPGCICESQCMSQDARFCGIMIEAEYMEEIRKNVGLRIDLTRRYHSYGLHTFTQAALDNYMKMYKLIVEELACSDYEYKKDVIQRYCEIWVLKNISLNDESNLKPELSRPLNRREQIFHDFLTLLEENYMQERSVSFYANRMCLTPKYLSTIIKEVSGKHGMQWIDEYVTLEAKALLRNSNLTVKEIGDQLHFPSQSMFGRFFKKMTGYSPKQYKQL